MEIIHVPISSSSASRLYLASSVADSDPHHFGGLDPDQHYSRKLYLDPHHSGKLDPDPHQSEKQHPDPYPYQREKVEATGLFWSIGGSKFWEKERGTIRIKLKGTIWIRVSVKGRTLIRIRIKVMLRIYFNPILVVD
jgi:hypothetical protein